MSPTPVLGLTMNFYERKKSTLQVSHCDCSLLHTEYEGNNSVSWSHLLAWGDSITMVTGEAKPSIPCLVLKCFICLAKNGMESFDLPPGFSFTHDWWFKMHRALIIQRTKPNHVGDWSVDLCTRYIWSHVFHRRSWRCIKIDYRAVTMTSK